MAFTARLIGESSAGPTKLVPGEFWDSYLDIIRVRGAKTGANYQQAVERMYGVD
jgi:hypothetical protein